MSLANNLNKENFRLLDVSSDGDSEDLQLEIIPSRRKKVTRRERSKINTSRVQEPNIGAEVQCAFRWAMRGTLLLWLLMLTWICAALYDQVSTMRTDIAKVSTSSDSVGDALQVCHTAAQELRANTSNLNTRLTTLELEHQELAKRVKKAAGDLAAVSDQLAAAPKLADTPKRLAELQRLVADFGSQIKGFDSALATARKQAVTAASGVEEVRSLLNQLDGRTNETIANVSNNIKHDEELRQQVTELNNTLAAKVEALHTRIEEMSKPASTAAPSSTSTTSSTTTSSTSSTPPPGPPAKPNVLGTQ